MKKLLLLFSLALPLMAREPVANLAELKMIEAKVEAVTRKVTPSVVLIFSTETGASGSGVVVSDDGLILTAAHVTDRTDRVNIVFPDGTEERGKVLGSNFTRDAAMVQLLGDKKWPFAEVGDSKILATGDFVVAMGHPKGYDPTRRPPVRFGRVMTRGELGFVTTDCTLIGGDSGGPLFDLDGKVVGIHSNIAALQSVNNHAGSESYLRDWKQMKSGKTWGRLGANQMRGGNRPVLGVVLEEKAGGMLEVTEVLDGSPAAEAGLEPGDLVTKLEGRQVSGMDDFQERIHEFVPGDKVKITRTRKGAAQDLAVTLARRGSIY